MTDREKAHQLVDAFFDEKEILVKDEAHGVKHWVSVYDPNYWTYLTEFCKNINKYRIFEDVDEKPDGLNSIYSES